ncbi:MAG: hypothetical protein AAB597_03640, partial [Patescibacteria group bacterium]
ASSKIVKSAGTAITVLKNKSNKVLEPKERPKTEKITKYFKNVGNKKSLSVGKQGKKNLAYKKTETSNTLSLIIKPEFIDLPFTAEDLRKAFFEIPNTLVYSVENVQLTFSHIFEETKLLGQKFFYGTKILVQDFIKKKIFVKTKDKEEPKKTIIVKYEPESKEEPTVINSVLARLAFVESRVSQFGGQTVAQISSTDLETLNANILASAKTLIDSAVAGIERRIPPASQNPVVYLTSSAPSPYRSEPAQTVSGVSAGFGNFSQGLGTAGDLTATGHIKLGDDGKTAEITSNTWRINKDGDATGLNAISAKTLVLSNTLRAGTILGSISIPELLTISRFNATSTSATSTIAGGLDITGGGLQFTNLDCSTFASGGALTTDSSGNITCSDDGGGTPSGASGEIQFNLSNALASSNNLYWDNTNGLFGLGGTTTPSGQLTIEMGTSTYPIWIGDQAAGSTTPTFVVRGNGRIGIGTSTPESLFSVHGGVLIAGTTTVNGLIATSSIIVLGNATSTFQRGINIASGCFAINDACVGAGSGSVNTGTAGNLAFYSTTGSVVSETDNLFFDNAGDRLGILTTSPKQALHVQGSGIIGTDLDINGGDINLGTGSATTTLSGGFGIGVGTTTPGASFAVATGTAAVNTAVLFSNLGTGNTLWVEDEANDLSPFVIDSSGRLGVGTSTPGALFSVQGNAIISGTTSVHALHATSSIQIGVSPTANWIRSSATSTLANGLDLTGGGLRVTGGTQLLDNILLATSSGATLTVDYRSVLATTTVKDQGKNVFSIATSSNTTPIFSIDTGDGALRWGRVGIGTSSPGTVLDVRGDIAGTGRLTIDSIYATSTSATSTIRGAATAGGLLVDGGALRVTGTASSSFTGGLTISSGLQVAGGTRLLNPITFTDLDCSGLSNGGTLTTDGQGTVLCAADDSGGAATAAGASGQLQFSDGTTLAASSNLFFNNTYGFLGLGGTSTPSTVAAEIPQFAIEMGTSTYPIWIGDQGLASSTPTFVVRG